MRHSVAGRKLGRTTAHRLALFRNQLASLIVQERIVTTLHKAKELRPIAERVVTQGKRGSVHARRLVGRWIQDRDLVKRLFDEIAPRFAQRPGGYLRIVRLGHRQGDGAEMAVLEFVDFTPKKSTASPDDKSKKAKSESGEKGSDGGEKAAKPAKQQPAAKKPGEKRIGKSVSQPPKPRPSKSPSGPKKTSAPKKVGGS